MPNCLNCNTPLVDRYCPHCGQSAAVKRLSWHSITEEFFHFFTHIEKGFLFTVKELSIHPGSLFKNYLEGKRKTYHKPISFLLIWITVFILVLHEGSVLRHFEAANTETLLTQDARISTIINKYRSLLEVLMIPLISVLAWLIVARPKLAYVEIIAVNFYSAAFLFVVLSLQLIVAVIFNLNFKTNTFDLITLTIFSLWVIYAGYDFFRRYHIRLLWVRLIIYWAISALLYFYVMRLFARALIKLDIT